MNNIEKYVNKLNNIAPSQKLIDKTIERIENIEQKRNKNNLMYRLKKVVIIILSVLTCTGGVAFATSKILDYKFTDFFHMNTGELEEKGVNICEIGKTIKKGGINVTLEQLISDNNNVYILLTSNKTIYEYKIIDDNKYNEEKLFDGEINLYNLDDSNSVIFVLSTDNIKKDNYITVRLIFENKKYIDITTKLETTVTKFTKNIDTIIENEKNEKNEKMILKNIKISPIGIQLILDITDVKYDEYEEYLNFNKEIIYKTKNSDKEINLLLNNNSFVYNSEGQIIEKDESIDGKKYISTFISFEKIIDINDIIELRLGNSKIDVVELIKNGADDESYSNINNYKKEENDNKTEEKVKEFLTSSYWNLSSEESVGSTTPPLYYFGEDGKFSYYNGESIVEKEGQIISSRGEWILENNKLTIKIYEEKYAEGGSIIKNDELYGTYLENYNEKIRKTNKEEIHEVNLKKYNNIVYVELNDFNLYHISIGENYMEILKNLAENL